MTERGERKSWRTSASRSRADPAEGAGRDEGVGAAATACAGCSIRDLERDEERRSREGEPDDREERRSRKGSAAEDDERGAPEERRRRKESRRRTALAVPRESDARGKEE